MKHHNPHTPILIREASGVEPRVYARYEFGREKMADLHGTLYSNLTGLEVHEDSIGCPISIRWREYRQKEACVCWRPADVLWLILGLDDKAIEEKVTMLVKDGQ